MKTNYRSVEKVENVILQVGLAHVVAHPFVAAFHLPDAVSANRAAVLWLEATAFRTRDGANPLRAHFNLISVPAGDCARISGCHHEVGGNRQGNHETREEHVEVSEVAQMLRVVKVDKNGEMTLGKQKWDKCKGFKYRAEPTLDEPFGFNPDEFSHRL